MQLDPLLLLNEILFVNFEVLKRTGNIKKRGYYPVPGINPRRSSGFAVGSWVPV